MSPPEPLEWTTPASAASGAGILRGCEFIASAVNGVTTDVTTNADYAAACGIGGTPLPPTAGAGLPSIKNLALAIGNKDGVLTKSDFSSSPNESWDDNQLSTACTAAGVFCTLDVFVFVNDEQNLAFALENVSVVYLLQGELQQTSAYVQRALDIANHLLRRKLSRRQYMDLVDRTAVAGNYPCRYHTRQSQDQFFGALDREYAARDRGGQARLYA